jgi:hypothetical protein
VDLCFELLRMNLVLLDQLFDFILVEILDADQAVLLLFGPLELVLQGFDLNTKGLTCLLSNLFS